MQSYIMTFYKTLVIVASLTIMFGFIACLEEKQASGPFQKAAMTAQAQMSFPELLPRNPALGSVEEQVKMSDIYADLTRKIQQDPADHRSRIQLAQLFMLEARVTGEHGHYYPASLTVLDELLANDPPQDAQFGALSLKASVYLSLHRFEEAKKLAEEAVKLNSYNSLIYGSLVDANVELGDYETAIQMADKMVAIRPDLRSYSRVSYLREIHGDMEGAIEAMQMAVGAGYPGYEETAWCRLTLGELIEQSGDLTAAREQYEQILAERPNYPFAMAALARIDAEEGMLEAAENRVKQAIAIIPEFSFYEQLAEIYRTTAREEEAEATIQSILEMLADDEAKGHKMGLEYANVYLNLKGDPQTALEYAKKEYTLRPENIDVNKVLAEIYWSMGESKMAKAHLIVANRTGSQHPHLQQLNNRIQS
ncbi:MAG: tetratricopeptide repeat protein [Bacteroidota bacterium]